jgi:hypothetical protein
MIFSDSGPNFEKKIENNDPILGSLIGQTSDFRGPVQIKLSEIDFNIVYRH